MILYRESKRNMSTSNYAVIHTDGELGAGVLDTTTSRASSTEMIHDEHDHASASSEREIETLPQYASTLKDNSHEHEKVTVSKTMGKSFSTSKLGRKGAGPGFKQNRTNQHLLPLDD